MKQSPSTPVSAEPMQHFRPTRIVTDVSKLPTVTFGVRSLAWWGTLGFAVIEGITLFICVVSYFYLRRNFFLWPSLNTPLPSLPVPIAGLVVMLLSLVPMWFAAQAAKKLRFNATRIALAIALLFKLAVLVMRWFEFRALNTQWNSDAYGSVVWVTLGFHTTLLIIDVAEDIGLLLMFFLSSHIWARHFSDVDDDAFYWYMTVAMWIPLFIMLYLLPSWI